MRDGKRRHDTCVVADRDGVIGCAWLSTSGQRLRKYNVQVTPRPGEGYVYGVFVDSGARRQGAAYSMLCALGETAAREGVTSLLAHISPRNPATPHLFIDRLGGRVREQTHVLVLLNRFGVPLHTARRDAAEFKHGSVIRRRQRGNAVGTPPSTGITAPVIAAERSEARKATVSATSRVLTRWPRRFRRA
jgi:hypothetical protein